MKLTKKHIPRGYKYGIVDDQGNAWATANKPILKREHDYGGFVRAYWTNLDPVSRLIGKGFDSSDWQNSLVSVED